MTQPKGTIVFEKHSASFPGYTDSIGGDDWIIWQKPETPDSEILLDTYLAFEEFLEKSTHAIVLQGSTIAVNPFYRELLLSHVEVLETYTKTISCALESTGEES